MSVGLSTATARRRLAQLPYGLILLVWAGLLASNQVGMAQGQVPTRGGTVYGPNDEPLSGARVTVSGPSRVPPTTTNEDGSFEVTLPAPPAGRPATPPYTLRVDAEGFAQRVIRLLPRDTARVVVRMRRLTRDLEEVAVETRRDRSLAQAGLIEIEPRTARVIPSPFGDFNRLLATLPGVITASELTSEYSVRGGGYDENLIYVNDMEIYRPLLVRNGQQEGLSFVNPEMVESAQFSAGGWQPRFGDKLSSVLDVRYRRPTRFGGTVQAGLLTQSLTLHGATKDGRLSVLGGVRRKAARYLFDQTFLTRGLPVQGQYRPRFVDYQQLVSYQLQKPQGPGSDSLPRTGIRNLTLSWLSAAAGNDFSIIPESQQSDFGTLASVIRLDVGFIGQERLTYQSWQNALKLEGDVGAWRSNLTVSYLRAAELERNDIEGGYRLCDVQTNPTRSNFNRCVNLRGIGTIYNYGRNRFESSVTNVLWRNQRKVGKHQEIELGGGFAHEALRDRLNEYGFVDSADFVRTTALVEATNAPISQRYSGYAQHTLRYGRGVLTYGARAQYWTLNQQLMISPRIQGSLRLDSAGRQLLKMAGGVYQQPAFYREMRDSMGLLVTNLPAQRSYHLIAAYDLAFEWLGRPFRLMVEGYGKYYDRVIPYDVDNVRLRYLPRIPARAYAVGGDVRLSGEFLPGLESWFSLGLLTTRENLEGDSIGVGDERRPQEWVRRPTDQRVTLSVFFQDQLPNNPSARVYLSTVIGSGLPFSPPGQLAYRGFFNGPFYRRIDIGFSKVVSLGDRSSRLGRHFETLWLGLDILNLIGINNVNSYTWVRDIEGNQFGVPNYLSARFFNLKVRVDF